MEDLWKIRKRKKMTVAQLSAKAGIPVHLIHEYEAGQKTIPSQNLTKLAKALYVDVMDIKPLSDPIPTTPFPKPKPAGKHPASPPVKPKKVPPAPSLVRPSQINHLLRLAERFNKGRADLEEEIGKPLEELTRLEASQLLRKYQYLISEEKPQPIKKKRGYLPETVDTFEFQYLTRQQSEGSTLTFTLFDGKVFNGTIMGFSPYAITIREEESGDELTIQKLAIAYYRKMEVK
ncbi:MAG: helix-turn-helix domain-containing protein [Anaerolineae bacterium]